MEASQGGSAFQSTLLQVRDRHNISHGTDNSGSDSKYTRDCIEVCVIPELHSNILEIPTHVLCAQETILRLFRKKPDACMKELRHVFHFSKHM